MEKEFQKNLDSIFILGRGASLLRCPVKKPKNVEYWGCNSAYRARDIDRLFIMHNPQMTQFRRDKELIDNINKKEFPVYTLGKYKSIKNNIEYPVNEVIKEFDVAFFLTNISYMLALAIIQKPKSIHLFGVDMTFGAMNEYMRNEKGCIEFWLGVAIGKGIQFHLPVLSTLLKRKNRENFYGMLVKRDKDTKTIQISPQYWQNREKCAAKYKIERYSGVF